MTTSGSCRCRFLVTVAAEALLAQRPSRGRQGRTRRNSASRGHPGSAIRTTPSTATVATTVATTTSTSGTTQRRTAWKARHPSGRRPRTALCSFNLDLVGLEVRQHRGRWQAAHHGRRSGQELVVTPEAPPEEGAAVRGRGAATAACRWSSSCRGSTSRTGFMTTADGANVIGQPEVAAAWYPVNDHPIDKASYSFEVTVPDGYEVVANGFLRGSGRSAGARRPGSGRPASRWRRTWPRSTSGSGTSTAGAQTAGLPVYDAVDPAIPGGLRAEIDSSLARQGEILDLPERRLRAVSVQHGRCDRRQPGRPLLRARDPDPAGVFEALLARRPGQPGQR